MMPETKKKREEEEEPGHSLFGTLLRRPLTTILALGGAVLIWSVVQGRVVESVEIRNVEVRPIVQGNGEDFAIMEIRDLRGNELLDRQISLNLRGPAGNLNRLQQEEMSIEADIPAPDPGENRISVTLTVNESKLSRPGRPRGSLPSEVSMEPPGRYRELTVVIERIRSEERDVIPEQSADVYERFLSDLSPAEEYEIVELRTFPSTVRVTGPNSLLEQSQLQVPEEERLNPGGAVRNISQTVSLGAGPGFEKLRIEPAIVELVVEIQSELTTVTVSRSVDISMNQRLFNLLGQAGWQTDPEGPEMEFTFSLPRNVVDEFGPDHFLPVLKFPEFPEDDERDDAVDRLEDALQEGGEVAVHSESIHIIYLNQFSDLDRIDLEEISPSNIRFLIEGQSDE